MYTFNQRVNHVSIEVAVRSSKSTMPAFNRSGVSAVFSLSTSYGLRYLSGSRVPTFVFSQESLSRDANGGWVGENPMEKGKSAWSVSPLESGHGSSHPGKSPVEPTLSLSCPGLLFSTHIFKGFAGSRCWNPYHLFPRQFLSLSVNSSNNRGLITSKSLNRAGVMSGFSHHGLLLS